jgi:HTH-type transcriptional regulator/antitoxin HigA
VEAEYSKPDAEVGDMSDYNWNTEHPGTFIQDELSARGWSIDTLAEKSGIQRYRLEEMLAGKVAVTPIAALGLAQAFGTSKDLWTNLQAYYEAHKK